MAAHEQQTVFLRQLARQRVIERSPMRAQENRAGARRMPGYDVIVRLEDGLAFHDQPVAAAVRVVVGSAMPVMRPIPQVVPLEFQ